MRSDRKSTRLNSSHSQISYAVFCLKKKRKVAPALASGSTIVLKPAEFTPLTALLFSEVAREVGLPPGVLNIVTGDGRTGAALVDHPDVDKIAFTGSTDVGRVIRKATAGSGKKLSLFFFKDTATTEIYTLSLHDALPI